ncbi:hypothetical protein ACH4UT_23675 [Streptomyces sp. NPDC020799]|uniref:hypothetical protein n=1 Tax=Streptomyces sp. NPDC020799 TaxID=3365091 RepID=UPI0037AA9952
MPSTTDRPVHLHEALVQEQYGRPLQDLLKELAPSPLAKLLQEQRHRPLPPVHRPPVPSTPDPHAAEHRAVLAEAIAPRRKDQSA